MLAEGDELFRNAVELVAVHERRDEQLGGYYHFRPAMTAKKEPRQKRGSHFDRWFGLRELL